MKRAKRHEYVSSTIWKGKVYIKEPDADVCPRTSLISSHPIPSHLFVKMLVKDIRVRQSQAYHQLLKKIVKQPVSPISPTSPEYESEGSPLVCSEIAYIIPNQVSELTLLKNLQKKLKRSTKSSMKVYVETDSEGNRYLIVLK